MAEPVSALPVIEGDQFQALDIRVGTVIDAQPFPEARRPAIRLWIDLGPAYGIRTSSAQLTRHYKPDQLIGRQVCVLANCAARRIGPFESQVLTLGLPDASGEAVLIRPDHTVPNGGRLF